MAYSGVPIKRPRLNEGGDRQSKTNTNFIEVPPSKVVHIRGLADTIIENDIINELQSFGPVSYVIMLPKNRQALVEFENIESSMDLIKHAQSSEMSISGRRCHFNFSTSQQLDRPPGSREGEVGNKVLLFTILNATYPITVDVIHAVCNPSGFVVRIVIFKKQEVHAMVEFDSLEAAKNVKQNLNGADIYSGCCSLKIEFAKPTTLNVFKNDTQTYDYTNPDLGGYRPIRPGFSQAPGQPAYRPPPARFPSYGPPRPPPGAYAPRNFYGGGQPPMPPSSAADYGGGDSGASAGPGGAMGGPEGGAVLMMYELSPDYINCQKVFNLLSVYGNVLMVKFMKSKVDACMVQMSDRQACERVMQNLMDCPLFGQKIRFQISKQPFLKSIQNPDSLKDGTPLCQDFSQSRANRFSNPDALQKNRMSPPSRKLFFYNAPKNFSADDFTSLFTTAGVTAPAKVSIFPPKSDKCSTGLLEWNEVSEAAEALATCNCAAIPNPDGKYPFTFKLSFSS